MKVLAEAVLASRVRDWSYSVRKLSTRVAASNSSVCSYTWRSATSSSSPRRRETTAEHTEWQHSPMLVLVVVFCPGISGHVGLITCKLGIHHSTWMMIGVPRSVSTGYGTPVNKIPYRCTRKCHDSPKVEEVKSQELQTMSSQGGMWSE